MKIEDIVPKEQTGFRQNRSCCEQVLSMVTHVENGFQERKKSGGVFLDLTCAVCIRNGLEPWVTLEVSKHFELQNDPQAAQTIEFMLKDRKFRVHLNGNISKYK